MSFSVTLYSDSVPSPFRTLIDSGSLHCYLDTDVADRYTIPTTPVTPIHLQLFNGTSNQTITRTASIPLHFPLGEIILVDFYVTPLNQSVSAVLGYSWLSAYNPLIDWKKHSIQFRTALTTRPIPELVPPPSPLLPPASTPEPASTPRAALPVSFVNAAVFAHACELPDATSHTLNLSVQEISAQSTSVSEFSSDLSRIPEDYHEFADVFSKAQADILPEHQPYDLKITIEDGAVPPLGLIYSLSKLELDTLCKYIDENIR